MSINGLSSVNFGSKCNNNSKVKTQPKAKSDKASSDTFQTKQKTIKTAVALTGTAALVAGGIYLAKSGKGKAIIDEGKKLVEKAKTFFTKNKNSVEEAATNAGDAKPLTQRLNELLTQAAQQEGEIIEQKTVNLTQLSESERLDAMLQRLNSSAQEMRRKFESEDGSKAMTGIELLQSLKK